MAALANPTPEMWKLMEIKRKLEEERQKMGWKEQLAEYNKRNMANKLKFVQMDLTPSYNTPIMEEVIAKRAARLARDNHTPEPSDDEMDEDEVFNVTVVENINVAGIIESSYSQNDNDQLQENLSPFPQSKVTHTPVDRILRSRTTTPKDSQPTPDGKKTPSQVSKPEPVPIKTKSRSVTPRTPNTTPVKERSRSCTPAQVDEVDLATPIIPAKARKVVGASQPPSEPTPAVASRTRSKNTSECLPDIKVDVNLPTPAPTAPPSPTTSPQTPGQEYESCTICFKTLNSRFLTRHYSTVHSMKRPLSSTPSRHSGLTPRLKRGRVYATPKSNESDTQPPPLLRHQTPLVGQEQEILPSRRKAVMDMELNPPDSPSKNIRVAPCPLCGVELAKSLIPKHFEDNHSPNAGRKTRKKKVDSMTGAMARVAVSTDTPEKIRNFDSPARPTITKETVGNIVSTFRRGLVL